MRLLIPLLACLCGLFLGASPLWSAPFDELDFDFSSRSEDTADEPPAANSDESDALNDPGLSSSAKAAMAYRNGQTEVCLSHLKDAVASKPTLPPPDLILAGFHLKAHRYQHARALLEQFAAAGSRHPQLFLSFAELALAERRWTDASAHLEIAENLGPPVNWNESEKRWFQSTILKHRTAIAEQRGNWQQAALLMEKWLQFEPDPLLRRRYAIALFADGKSSQAFEQFDIAHRSDARLSPPEVAMGALSLRQGEVEAANDWYAKAIAAHPNNAAARLEWSISLLYQDRAKEGANKRWKPSG